jgi:hypothetical protein
MPYFVYVLIDPRTDEVAYVVLLTMLMEGR